MSLHKIKIILACIICMASFSLQAQKAFNQARVYINPGHGGWGANDRPLATINWAQNDSLGFFETNTNLWKAQALRDELTKAGVGFIRMSRTRNGIIGSGTTALSTKYKEEMESANQIVTLSAICTDVETNNMDYFISIHSNASTEGDGIQFPIILYRGTNTSPYVGNGLVNARNMGIALWPYLNDNDITYHSHYHPSAPSNPTGTNIQGDITFMGGQGTTTINGISYVGYYGVLRHGCDGYLSEGCFHTYRPERQRLLNKDYCRQEGVRYSRAIRAWFGNNTETKGCIMGAVRRSTLGTHSFLTNAMGNDQYYPINGATVVLKTASGSTVGTYTTDNEYNGVFVFTDLNPGTYTLTISANGYTSTTVNATVTANKTAFVNQKLTTGTIVSYLPNIFASELKVSSVDANRNVTFTYTLNTPASEVVISVSNGDVFTINSGTGLAKGVNSVTKTLKSTTPAGNYTWTVKATGVAANTNTGTTPIKFTDDNINEMKYYSPRGGLAMDKSMDSPFFGRIYISESLGSTTGGRTTQDGIYILNAALQDITNQGNTSYKGGQTWTYNGTAYDLTPYRVSVAPDGKVLIPKNHATNPGIWIMDPANPGGNFATAFGSTTIYGRPIQSHLINGDLFLFDETFPAAYNILRFNNFSTGRTAARDALAFSNPSSIITPIASTGTATASFVPDGKGGFWIGQHRNTANAESAANPSLIHISSSGAVDFNSFNMAANKIGPISRGVIAFNKEKDLIAVGCSTQVKVYEVVWTSNVPTLKTSTAPISFDATLGVNIDGLEFDPANNLYIVSASNERLVGFSLPNANAAANTFTTTAPASNPVVVDGAVSSATEYYVPNNPNNGKTWYSTLKAACDAINAASITDDVTLWVNGNITSGDNVGLVNNTTKSITVKPVSGMTPIIEFTKSTANAGPAGAFIIGSKTGLANTDVAPAKNITLDGLTLKTVAGAHCSNYPVTLADACDNITITNCTIEHLGAATATTTTVTSAIFLTPVTTAPGQGVMPKNVKILKNTITNAASIGYTQAIGFYNATGLADPLKMSSGVEISGNVITTFQRGIFFENSNDITISNNEFHIKQGRTGVLSSAIQHPALAANTNTFNVYVRNNRFIELTSANVATGDAGVKAIITGGPNSTWYIENNYFTGFGKTAAASTSSLQAIRTGTFAGGAMYIQHNTFHLNVITSNAPTGNSATPGVADPAYWAINIANTAPVIQNNLFVSDEDAFPNFFIRGTVPTSATNNVFCRQGGTTNAKILVSGTLAGAKEVASVVFKNAVAGDLSLSGASEKDANLKVPRLVSILTDIAGTERKNPTFAGACEVPDPVGINVALPDNGVRVICIGSLITIIADAPIQSAKLFDLQGRMLESKQDVAVYSLTAPAKGVYIVETITKNGRNVQKVTVR